MPNLICKVYIKYVSKFWVHYLYCQICMPGKFWLENTTGSRQPWRNAGYTKYCIIIIMLSKTSYACKHQHGWRTQATRTKIIVSPTLHLPHLTFWLYLDWHDRLQANNFFSAKLMLWVINTFIHYCTLYSIQTRSWSTGQLDKLS